MVEIYTDGACKGNPGSGGWGAYIINGDETKSIWGGEPNTTNNKMELTSVIMALDHFKEPTDMTVYMDSQYVQKGITQWILNWKRNGWKTADKQPVKNKDLWIQLDALKAKHNVTWKWVKGHATSPGNNKADELANMGVYSKSE